MYFRARYYDPGTGEFISRDPLEYVDGMSLYRAYFVPGKVDPNGTKVICIGLGGSFVYGGGGGLTVALCVDGCGNMATIGFYKILLGLGASVGGGIFAPGQDCISDFKRSSGGWEVTGSVGPVTGTVGGPLGGGPSGGGISCGPVGVGVGSNAGATCGDVESPWDWPDPRFPGRPEWGVDATAGINDHVILGIDKYLTRCPCPPRPPKPKPDPGTSCTTGEDKCDTICRTEVFTMFGNQKTPASIAAYERCMDNCYDHVMNGRDPFNDPFDLFD
ncbi:MAG: hypothetical protein AAF623_05575 [Planctomycetota bacterium]